ncbi:MAG: M56 family metallopeptidase [Planctomycetaceae bacterium]
MNSIDAFLLNRTAVMETIGLALMHFVWQGLLIAALLKLALSSLRRSSPQTRYLFCCVAMLILALLPPVTFTALALRSTPETSTSIAAQRQAEVGGFAHADSTGRTGSPASPQSSSTDHSAALRRLTENLEPTAVAQSESRNTSGSESNTSLLTLTQSQQRALLRAGTLLWMLGVIFLSIRLLLSWAWIRRLRLASTPCVRTETLQTVRRLSKSLRIRSAVRLFESTAIDVPMVIGWLRPAILFPFATMNCLSVSQLEAILAHELEHIRRADYLVNFLQNLVETVLFYHPAVWWVSSRIRQEREYCCDDVASASCGNARHYVEALLRLEELRSVPKSVIVASTGGNLLQRARRLLGPVDSQEVVPPWHAGAALLLATFGIGIALFSRFPALEASTGHTTSNSSAPIAQQAARGSQAATETGNYAAEGVCIDAVDQAPLAGVDVRLFAQHGLLAETKEVGSMKTDANGRFRFPNLPAPSNLGAKKLQYVVLAQMEGRPPAQWPLSMFQGLRKDLSAVRIFREGDAISGRVVNEQGRPVSGANIKSMYWLPDGLDGTPHFRTGNDGLFRISELPVTSNEVPGLDATIFVSHPDYPTTTVSKQKVPGTAKIVLIEGCHVAGTVHDSSGKPVDSAVISVVPESLRESRSTEYCRTDADGKFRICVPEGSYSFLLSHEAFVSEALTGVECRKGQPLQLKTMIAEEGGWLAGQIMDLRTSKPMVRSTSGSHRITIGVFGKANPNSTEPLAEVDDEGRFRVRVMPGENFPFTINQQTNRMSWDTQQQTPVIVKSGEETFVQLDFAPPATAPDMLARGQAIIDSLPTDAEPRAEAIIAELRKYDRTVDGCEVWCMLLREVVKIGPPAVLPLCKELESTNSNPMMRRIAVALRALNDPRAVPSLIRTLPRTLLPSSSDYGLVVEDAELASFMRENSIKRNGEGVEFDLGRPVREIHATIEHLTKHKSQASAALASISRRTDLRALTAQEKIFHETASEWAQWWQANASTFNVPEEFRSVNLPPFVERDLSNYPKGLNLTANAQEDSGLVGMVLSPASEDGEYTNCFMNLDTRRDWRWPAELTNKADTPEASKAATDWARRNGADLYCAARPDADGNLQYVLVGVDTQFWEIDQLSASNLEKRLKQGSLPTGRKLEQPELLHFDPVTGKHSPEIGSSFLYLTKDEGLGVITITDFVVEARDITGQAGTPPGVGFHRGVRFNLTHIAR